MLFQCSRVHSISPIQLRLSPRQIEVREWLCVSSDYARKCSTVFPVRLTRGGAAPVSWRNSEKLTMKSAPQAKVAVRGREQLLTIMRSDAESVKDCSNSMASGTDRSASWKAERRRVGVAPPAERVSREHYCKMQEGQEP